jgi:hypothetical protein
MSHDHELLAALDGVEDLGQFGLGFRESDNASNHASNLA